jgi:hypothetical protein
MEIIMFKIVSKNKIEEVEKYIELLEINIKYLKEENILLNKSLELRVKLNEIMENYLLDEEEEN